MVIRDRLNRIELLIVLAAALMLSFGCGTDDESIVEPDQTHQPGHQIPSTATVSPRSRG